VDSHTKVLVPMLSVTGTFKYKTDASGTFSVVEVPLSETALLVLLQPVNGSDLEHVESELSLQSPAWLQQLSPRYQASRRDQRTQVPCASLPARCLNTKHPRLQTPGTSSQGPLTLVGLAASLWVF